MQFDESGQLFSSAGSGSQPPAGAAELASYQPAKALPGEGAEYDALAFDMGAAGFSPVHWTRPKEDLSFVIRQPTIPEQCRGVRLLPEGATADELGRIMMSITVSRIGAQSNPGEDEVLRWLDDLHATGADLVARAAVHVCHPSAEADKAFAASRTYDPGRKCFDFRLPRALLPKKSTASIPDSDLSFSMRELTYREASAADDACDDPDDVYAIRVLKIMWSISQIGDKVLSHSAGDLLLRRRWLARVGHPAWLLIAGTFTRMHEVDRGLVDRFLSSAATPT